jgi:hypothetical protein
MYPNLRHNGIAANAALPAVTRKDASTVAPVVKILSLYSDLIPCMAIMPVSYLYCQNSKTFKVEVMCNGMHGV